MIDAVAVAASWVSEYERAGCGRGAELHYDDAIMTSSSVSPHDIAALSRSAQSMSTPHDSYDYDPQSQRQFFQTSPAVHAQSHYSQIGLNQSPLKNKSSRAGLPAVCFVLVFCVFHSQMAST